MGEESNDPTAGATILIADDNPENLGILARMLAGAGLRVRVARDGAQALQSAAAERPDLVILDAHMPDIDGFEVCRRMLADPRLAGTPVVFISALSDSGSKREAFEAGAMDYIEKPFRFEDVLVRAKNAIRLCYYKRRCAELEDELARRCRPAGEG